ncbi:hypothetical protein [Sphingobium sp. MK2]|uniref:hypothetical protein n=1 Tax=Sphingobium sp. MK2 TaxID=3116540 RepID=UPI0032E3601C
MTLEERVREQIGAEGPQLPVADYHERIERELEGMSNAELLRRISDEISESIIAPWRNR